MKKKLLGGLGVLLVAIASLLIIDACSFKRQGVYVSLENAEDYCWTWCGVRTLQVGYLEKKEGTGWMFTNKFGIFRLPNIAIVNSCNGMTDVSVTGLVKRYPWNDDYVFYDIDAIVGGEPKSLVSENAICYEGGSL